MAFAGQVLRGSSGTDKLVMVEKKIVEKETRQK